MRVLHVVRQFSPSVGGLEDVVLNLARAQREAYGIDARVLTLDRVFAHMKPHDPGPRLPRRDVVSGIAVTRIPWAGSTRYPIAPGVFWHIRDADIIHVHAIDFFIDALALTWLFHRRPVVVLTQGGFFHTPKQARLKRIWFNAVTRLSLKFTAAVIAGSANDFAMFASLRPPRLLTIENGVDVSKLRAPAAGLPDPHRIITIGRLARHKRVAELFPLLAALRQRAPDWTLVVAGVEGDETFPALRAAAARCGVGDAVRFLDGAPDATLAAEAAQASWFACASAFEGFGVAAVEAVAAGLVPILSRIPTFERLATTLPASILFDPDAPAEAASRIAALDDAIAPRRAALRTDLAQSVDRYDWSQVTGRFVALYEEVLAPGTAPQARRA